MIGFHISVDAHSADLLELTTDWPHGDKPTSMESISCGRIKKRKNKTDKNSADKRGHYN